MIEAKDEEEVHAIMAQTSVGKRYLKGTEGFEDDIPLRVQYDTANPPHSFFHTPFRSFVILYLCKANAKYMISSPFWKASDTILHQAK